MVTFIIYNKNLSASRNILFTYFQVCVIGMASSQKGKTCPVSFCRQTEDVYFMESELLNCRKLLKIDVGKYGILELGQLRKQISVFHEIDIESMKSILKVNKRMATDKNYKKLNSEILLLSLETGSNTT